MRPIRHLLAGVVGVLALAACGAPAEQAPTAPPAAPAQPARNVQVSATFNAPPGTAATYDEELVPAGSRGKVSAESADGSTTVELTVSGLQPNRRYGAHAHTKPCGAKGEDAGPHFQNEVDPVQPSVDPQYANAQNEIWLDFTTDAEGAATATATVPFGFGADRRPESVVIHAMETMTAPGKAGTAGARAGCITVDF